MVSFIVYRLKGTTKALNHPMTFIPVLEICEAALNIDNSISLVVRNILTGNQIKSWYFNRRGMRRLAVFMWSKDDMRYTANENGIQTFLAQIFGKIL